MSTQANLDVGLWDKFTDSLSAVSEGIVGFLGRLFGSSNERLVRALGYVMPFAFAACREVAKRTKNMRHFDVQIVGGAILHGGKIAEMVTGEGKTLVATLPAYLNALTGGGVHIITVNDYLARRDCEWMSPIYHGLGISCS